MDFSALKKKRTELQNKLKEKVENLNSNSYADDRVWKITADKTGNGLAIIRYLMAPKDEDFPFVRYFSHAFKGPGGWYIQNCPTTLGKPCPVCEANTVLWNSEIEANKDIVRKRKRKLTYVSNILVIDDLAVPENNGKVFLFKYGAKIFEKINDLLNPVIASEVAVNPFDFWDGCNFKLKIAQVAGYPNYDKSQFESCSPLLGGNDSKIETVWGQEYPLSPFVAEKEFKPYAELKTQFDKVIGNVAGGRSSSAANTEINEREQEAKPQRSTAPRRGKSTPPPEEDDAPPFEEDNNDTDDIMKRFQELADK